MDNECGFQLDVATELASECVSHNALTSFKLENNQAQLNTVYPHVWKVFHTSRQVRDWKECGYKIVQFSSKLWELKHPYRTTHNPAKWVPSPLIKPVKEFIKPISTEVMSWSVVEPKNWETETKITGKTVWLK